MEKTRSIDFDTLSLKDALDMAELVEQEAKDRYEEFADQMDIHHNPEAARFFRFMLGVEAKHEDKLAQKRKALFGTEPRTVHRGMIFDIEAPEYDEARATMTVRQALDAALRSETKAFEFFDGALKRVKDAQVRELFEHLREEEREHIELVKKEIAKLGPDAGKPPPDDDYGDDPVAL